MTGRSATRGRGRQRRCDMTFVTTGAIQAARRGRKLGVPPGFTVLACAALLAVAEPALAENIRGASTGPTSAPGFSHPEQYMHLKDVKPAPNMYPVIRHPEQDKAAADKLAALAERTGKKPNIMIFLLDDVG